MSDTFKLIDAWVDTFIDRCGGLIVMLGCFSVVGLGIALGFASRDLCSLHKDASSEVVNSGVETQWFVQHDRLPAPPVDTFAVGGPVVLPDGKVQFTVTVDLDFLLQVRAAQRANKAGE